MCDIASFASLYGEKITGSAKRKKNRVSKKIRKKTGSAESGRRLGWTAEITEKRFTGTHPKPLLYHRAAARVYPRIRFVANMYSRTGTKRAYTRS